MTDHTQSSTDNRPFAELFLRTSAQYLGLSYPRELFGGADVRSLDTKSSGRHSRIPVTGSDLPNRLARAAA